MQLHYENLIIWGEDCGYDMILQLGVLVNYIYSVNYAEYFVDIFFLYCSRILHCVYISAITYSTD